MARIVGGNPNGEFRGKLGGLIFSRNKGGQYAKAYAMPVDANTAAQIANRVNFAQAISAFHSLNAADKGGWNIFAGAYFSSKARGNVPGLHSGANAFVSLRNTLLNMARTQTLLTGLKISVNGTPATAEAQADVIINSIAPVTPMQGVLGDGSYSITNHAADFSVTSQVIKVTLGVSWNASPSFPTPDPSTSSILIDGGGKKVGFAVYASNLLVQQGVSVSNPDIVLVGNTGIIDDYTTSSVVTSLLEIEFERTLDFAGYKNPVVANGIYRLQTYMFNSEGQVVKVGESTIAVGS